MRRFGSTRTAVAALAVATAVLAGGAAGTVQGPPSGAALEALSAAPTRAPVAAERFYFVMPDRYANGDPSNDGAGLRGGRSLNGFDPTDTGWYHGGDFAGLKGDCTSPTAGLARVKALGFTALWVTPPFGQRWVQGSSAAYHGYWFTDLTSVDRHLGTDADFGAFVSCAHSLGLKVYLDVVVNHTGDVITASGGGFLEPSDVPYRDCRGKRFVPERYATGTTFPCLSPTRYFARAPVVLAGDRAAKKPAWLNDVRRYHNRGDIDFGSCSETCFEQGDFFGLDDIFTEQPAVVDGLAQAYGAWITRYKIDGFRIDTARHVNRAFFGSWVPKILAIARAAGVPQFQLFGEVYLTDAVELSTSVRKRGLPNVLDFPLQDALVRFAGGSAGAKGIAARLADDDYFLRPDGVAPTPTTFLGNHDMGRAARQIADQSGATGPKLLQRVLLGHDLLYLLRGAPVVMYGDEFGIVGRGGDKEARQDLFPTQVTEWRSEARVGSPPIGTGSSFDVVGNPVGERLRQLGKLRDAVPALSTGASITRLARQSTLVVSRIDSAARREVVAAFNTGAVPATVTFATSTPGASWTPLLGSKSATSGADGRLTLTIPPLSTLLLEPSVGLPARKAQVPTLGITMDDLSGLWQVRAAVAGADPVSVAVAVRRRGGAWKRLAVDDAPPYRAFLDPTAFRRNERVELAAVVRASDGSVAVSASVPFVVRRP